MQLFYLSIEAEFLLLPHLPISLACITMYYCITTTCITMTTPMFVIQTHNTVLLNTPSFIQKDAYTSS